MRSAQLALAGAVWSAVLAWSAEGRPLRPELTALAEARDAGPEHLVGADERGFGASSYLWCDLTAQGDSTDYRLFFDYQDARNFHFVDRRGAKVALGLREEGLEQVLARGEAPAGANGALRVARHGLRLGVFYGNQLVLAAFEERRLGGQAGWRNRSPAASLAVRAEGREEIRFADAFMRRAEAGPDAGAGAWRTFRCGPDRGDFAVKSLRNPLLSADAFNYMGWGKEALAVAGQPWWDNYHYEVSLRSPQNGRIGVIFAFQDEKNYGLVRWSAREVAADGSPTGKGERELVWVHEGKEEVLQRHQGGVLPHQWYRAEVSLTHARVRISLDSQAQFEVSRPGLACGAAGVWCDVAKPEKFALDPNELNLKVNSLWALMNQHAVFDDALVSSLEGYEDDFRGAGRLAHGWLVGLGRWETKADEAGTGGELSATPPAEGARSLIGSAKWGQYRVACDVQTGRGGAAGLVFLHRDESNYYCAQLDSERRLKLIQVKEGAARELAQTLLPAAENGEGFTRLGVTIRDGHLRVLGPGGIAVEAYDGSAGLRGRAGLWAKGAPARFRRFRLLFLDEAEPMISSNAVFEEEDTMREWTNPSRDWAPQQQTLLVDGEAVQPLWHTGHFPGDAELVVEKRELSERYEAALSVSKQNRDKKEEGGEEKPRTKSSNGYVFVFRGGEQNAAGERVARARILRAGKMVVEQEVAEPRELSTLGIRRAGRYVIGKVNGKPVIFFEDPEPLEGNRIAYYTKGLNVRPEATRIFSDHFYNDTFSKAPANWRSAGFAIAEVTNRWQCDPRWTFFTLKNDLERGSAAALWSKKLYPGDLCVEFYVGNKMEDERGPPYHYARDINVTICSDGSDLTKGYTFSFGGRGNEITGIYRNGELKQSVQRSIPTEMRRVHRAWMAVRVEKRGARLVLAVEGIPEEPPIQLVFDDPQPLTGDRVALWTFKHAVMLSRVRISGEGGSALEKPDCDFAPLKTFYEE